MGELGVSRTVNLSEAVACLLPENEHNPSALLVSTALRGSRSPIALAATNAAWRVYFVVTLRGQ